MSRQDMGEGERGGVWYSSGSRDAKRTPKVPVSGNLCFGGLWQTALQEFDVSVPSTRTIKHGPSRSASLSTTYVAPCSPNDLHGDNIMYQFPENFLTHSLRPLYG